MFEFRWPWLGILFFLPFAIRWYWRNHLSFQSFNDNISHSSTLLHPHLELLRKNFHATHPQWSLKNWFYPVLLWITWAALIGALMWPQWLTPHTEIKSPGYDLLLALDSSHSMEALDFTIKGQQVTRMQVVKGVIDRFIVGRNGDRVGLIIFGSQAFVLSPLTTDRNAVRQLLSGLMPNVAGQGTALGDAIALGTKKLRERPETSRVMILIADGDNTHGLFPPLEAAKVAARAQIRIYVIGVGSNEKSIPIYEEGQIRYRDDLTMDENTLKRIASITHGAYFRAIDTGALEEIYRQIDQLEKTQVEMRTAWLPTPLYRWPLSLSLVTLLILALFAEGRIRA